MAVSRFLWYPIRAPPTGETPQRNKSQEAGAKPECKTKSASRACACARQPSCFLFAMATFGILKSTTSKVKVEVGERLCPEVNIFSLHLLSVWLFSEQLVL